MSHLHLDAPGAPIEAGADFSAEQGLEAYARRSSFSRGVAAKILLGYRTE